MRQVNDESQDFGLSNWMDSFHLLIEEDYRTTDLGGNQLDLGYSKFYNQVENL